MSSNLSECFSNLLLSEEQYHPIIDDPPVITIPKIHNTVVISINITSLFILFINAKRPE
ncbi:Putative uncharacterized protein [Moritella viscosa]|nr:Putative uncharacterized protein [Moritella viscosa]